MRDSLCMTALAAGHVDGALVSPESVHKILASGCCRILADLADLPMDYARYGYAFPGSFINGQRDTLRRLLMSKSASSAATFLARP